MKRNATIGSTIVLVTVTTDGIVHFIEKLDGITARPRGLVSFYVVTVSMLMVALDWQSCINPVLLSFCIIPHVGVTQRRQFTGGVL